MKFQTGKILSDGDLKLIHDASLDILENIGVKIMHPEIYSLVVNNGARPGSSENIVYFPRDLVMRCLGQCPKKIVLCDRKGRSADLTPGGSRVYLTGNALNRTDGDNVVKPITRNDFCDYARLVDSLDQVFGMVGTFITDVPPKARDFAGFRSMLENTDKHLRPCLYSAEGAKVIMEMADVVSGGKPYEEMPFFSFGYSIVSPLCWSHEACEIFKQTAGHKIPLTINSEPLAGGTSPVTLAGSMVTGNAEVLSGIVINQIIEPGRPLIHNIGFAHLFDMYETIALTGAPENSLMAVAGAELAAHYGLPSASWLGTDSMTVDGQSCLEKMLTIFTQAASGINFIWGVGNIEATKCYSPVMAVLDNEMLGATERFLRGFEVNDNTLALDTIYDLGFNGDFLSAEHTFDNFRTENRYNTILNRTIRDKWQNAGNLTSEDKARKIVADIYNKPGTLKIEGSIRDKLIKIENNRIAGMGK